MEEVYNKDFQEILDQILGYDNITRENFYEILRNMNGKKLSTNEFFKLMKIIEDQHHTF